MRTCASLIVATLLAVSVVLTTSTRAATTPVRPDPTLTPGGVDLRVTQANLQQTICKFGYRPRTRTVSAPMKNRIYRQYHVKQSNQSRFDVDHLVPFSLGGSNVIDNLWPQVKSAAKQKDTVEDELHAAVCAGTTDLRSAQDAVVHDWTTAIATAVTTSTTTTTTLPPTPAVTPVVNGNAPVDCSPDALRADLLSVGNPDLGTLTTVRCTSYADPSGPSTWAFVAASGPPRDNQFLLKQIDGHWRVLYDGPDAQSAASSPDLLDQGINALVINDLFCLPRMGGLPNGCGHDQVSTFETVRL